jgi:hypothetical protein
MEVGRWMGRKVWGWGGKSCELIETTWGMYMFRRRVLETEEKFEPSCVFRSKVLEDFEVAIKKPLSWCKVVGVKSVQCEVG